MLETILSDHQHFHSTFQMDWLITVRSGGTLYGCYKQACHETWTRWGALREHYATRNAQNDPANRFAGDCVIRDTEREFLRFYGQAVALRRSLGLADGEAMPDDLRERLDVEMWTHRIRSMAAIDYLATGRLQRPTIELLQCCPVEMRKTLAAEITNPEQHQSLVEWWMGYDPCLPAPLAIPETEARRLLSCVSPHLSALPATGITEASLSSPAENTAAA